MKHSEAQVRRIHHGQFTIHAFAGEHHISKEGKFYEEPGEALTAYIPSMGLCGHDHETRPHSPIARCQAVLSVFEIVLARLMRTVEEVLDPNRTVTDKLNLPTEKEIGFTRHVGLPLRTGHDTYAHIQTEIIALNENRWRMVMTQIDELLIAAEDHTPRARPQDFDMMWIWDMVVLNNRKVYKLTLSDDSVLEGR